MGVPFVVGANDGAEHLLACGIPHHDLDIGIAHHHGPRSKLEAQGCLIVVGPLLLRVDEPG